MPPRPARDTKLHLARWLPVIVVPNADQAAISARERTFWRSPQAVQGGSDHARPSSRRSYRRSSRPRSGCVTGLACTSGESDRGRPDSSSESPRRQSAHRASHSRIVRRPLFLVEGLDHVMVFGQCLPQPHRKHHFGVSKMADHLARAPLAGSRSLPAALLAKLIQELLYMARRQTSAPSRAPGRPDTRS